MGQIREGFLEEERMSDQISKEEQKLPRKRIEEGNTDRGTKR